MDADRIVAHYQARLAGEAAPLLLAVPPNVLAGLATIKACEGTSGPDGYRALFGYPLPGRMFDDFSTHPRMRFPFTQTDGSINYTTAAGAYQEIAPTFDRLSKKLGTVDFTPPTQDLHAVQLIREADALEDLVDGLLGTFIEKCGGTWASLPSSRYKQPRRSVSFVVEAYTNSGGVIIA